jgi:hypothetical protein
MTRTRDLEDLSMRFKQACLAILASALVLSAATPVMAGGLFRHARKRDRYVVVTPAPVIRYRVIERVIIRDVKHGSATRVIPSPQVTYREITSTPSVSRALKDVQSERSISSVERPAQDRTIADSETQALERLQSKIADAAQNPSTSTRGLGDGGRITDNDLEPTSPR